MFIFVVVFLQVILEFSATEELNAFFALVFFQVVVMAIDEMLRVAEVLLDEAFADEVGAVGFVATVGASIDADDNADDDESEDADGTLHFLFLSCVFERVRIYVFRF